jgi:hypothetical protein
VGSAVNFTVVSSRRFRLPPVCTTKALPDLRRTVAPIRELSPALDPEVECRYA